MKHDREHRFEFRTNYLSSRSSADSSSKDDLDRVLSHIKDSIRRRKNREKSAAAHRRNSIPSFYDIHHADVPRVDILKNIPSEQGHGEHYLRDMGHKSKKGRKQRHDIRASFKAANWKANARKVDLYKELPKVGGDDVLDYSYRRKSSVASYSTSQISPGVQTICVGLIVNSPEDMGRTTGMASSPVLYQRPVDSNYQLQPLKFTPARPSTKIQDKSGFGAAGQETTRGQHRRTSSAKFTPIPGSAEEPREEQRDSVNSIYTQPPTLTHDRLSAELDHMLGSEFWNTRALSDPASPQCQMPGHADLSKYLRRSTREHHWGPLEYPEERETHFCNACYKSMPQASVYLNRLTMAAAERPKLEEPKTVSMTTNLGAQKQPQGRGDEVKKHVIVENVIEYNKHPNRLNSKFNDKFELSPSPLFSSSLASRRRGQPRRMPHRIPSTPCSGASSSARSKFPNGHVIERRLPEPKARSPRTPKSSIKLKPIIGGEDAWSDYLSVSSVEEIIPSSTQVGEPDGIYSPSPSGKTRISSGFRGSFDEIDSFYAEYVPLYDYPREGHMIQYLENHGIKQEVDGSY